MNSQTVMLDGPYTFRDPRHIMSPGLMISWARVPYRIETSASQSQVILSHRHGKKLFECTLTFDNAREAEEWVDERK